MDSNREWDPKKEPLLPDSESSGSFADHVLIPVSFSLSLSIPTSKSLEDKSFVLSEDVEEFLSPWFRVCNWFGLYPVTTHPILSKWQQLHCTLIALSTILAGFALIPVVWTSNFESFVTSFQVDDASLFRRIGTFLALGFSATASVYLLMLRAFRSRELFHDSFSVLFCNYQNTFLSRTRQEFYGTLKSRFVLAFAVMYFAIVAFISFGIYIMTFGRYGWEAAGVTLVVVTILHGVLVWILCLFTLVIIQQSQILTTNRLAQVLESSAFLHDDLLHQQIVQDSSDFDSFKIAPSDDPLRCRSVSSCSGVAGLTKTNISIKSSIQPTQIKLDSILFFALETHRRNRANLTASSNALAGSLVISFINIFFFIICTFIEIFSRLSKGKITQWDACMFGMEFIYCLVLVLLLLQAARVSRAFDLCTVAVANFFNRATALSQIHDSRFAWLMQSLLLTREADYFRVAGVPISMNTTITLGSSFLTLLTFIVSKV